MTSTLTASDLLYDPIAHVSRAPDGRDVPHVTAILSATGVATDFEALASRGRRMAETIEVARARGTAVHMDCHAYDDDDLVWESVDVRVRPYVKAWAAFRESTGLRPLAHARERMLFNPIEWYAGITDGIFIHPNNRLILVDLKTGDPDDAAADLQTAAYERAWTLEHPSQPIAERWAVALVPVARVPYRVTNYTARPTAYLDYGRFAACRCVYDLQRRRRS